MADWRTELQRILAALSDDASKGAIALMSRAVERLDRREALQFITEAFPEFISTYIAAAGDIGTTLYEDLPGGTTGFTAVTAALPAVEQLAANGRYMLLTPTTTVIQGVITRLVNGGVRDSQFANLAAEYGDPAILEDPGAVLGTLWARHASANACGFCRMLATRGAVYTSAEAATQVVGRGVDLTVSDQRAITLGQMTRAEALARRSVYRNAAQAARQGAKVGDKRKSGRTRGIQALGDKFHDHCHCIAVPVRPGASYQPAPYVDRWQKDYETALADIPAGTDYRDVPKLVAAAMDNAPGGSGPQRRQESEKRRQQRKEEAAPEPQASSGDSGGIDNGGRRGGRTGFGDPGDEFRPLPDGSKMPFRPSQVPPLNDGDYAHFDGTDGTGLGGHKFGTGWRGQTEFPEWVSSIDDLQEVLNAVVSNTARIQPGKFGQYELRALVNRGGQQMVVQAVLFPDGSPNTIYPISGDGVYRNNPDGTGKSPVPLNIDHLLGW